MADARQRATIAGQPVSISGDIVKVHGKVEVHGRVKISGQTVIAIISGLSINVSGAIVQVSGQVVNISGQSVVTTISLSGVTLAVSVSGQPVTISGNIVQVVNASGTCLCANISGQTVIAVVSGLNVNVSGAIIQVINTSGTCLCANISGDVVQISGQAITTSISGNIVLISGQSLSVALAQFTPIQKALLHNVTLPAIGTDLLGAALVPTNTPCTFRITIAVSISGQLKLDRINGGVEIRTFLNGGTNLNDSTEYTFDVQVFAGDTINLEYTATGGTIMILRISEIDAAVAST